ncbi:MAG: pyridoxal 5'-phosphate synthase glutaminase subunit PdxT [Dehalococcoidia bacterium]
MKRIGVLALQGAFREHLDILNQLGTESVPVRLPGELEGVDGLVIPGGESTTIGKLLKEYELAAPLQRMIADGMPVLGTCAGMILLASDVIGLNGYSLGAVDIQVRRNAFGRQVESFEADLHIPALGDAPFHAVFIRAPWIEKTGHDVQVLARLENGTPVAARSGNIVLAAFHPELTSDTRLHSYFVDIVNSRLHQ